MTERIIQQLCLLAAGPQNVWGRFDHHRPGDDGSHVFTLITAAVFVAGAVFLLFRLARSNKKDFCSNSTAGLFRELCRAHRISASNRRLLQRLAAARGLDNPAILFVEPRHFKTNDLPDALLASRGELNHLRERMF